MRKSKSVILKIADILANCHDWQALDLGSTVVMSILVEAPQLTEEKIQDLFNIFWKIPSEKRFSPEFDHYKVVKTFL